MNRVVLLERLKDFTEKSVSNLIMPTILQRGDLEQEWRAAEVHCMRLPDSKAVHKKAPYIIHQLITGQDAVSEGRLRSSVVVRSNFCVYNENETEGAMMLLNLMERLRIDLLKAGVVGEQFILDVEAGLETLVYPEDTAPHYAGEMISTWKTPTVQREVREWL